MALKSLRHRTGKRVAWSFDYEHVEPRPAPQQPMTHAARLRAERGQLGLDQPDGLTLEQDRLLAELDED